jgi:hypothetical protein
VKRYRESCGPGDASGWYCTEKQRIEGTERPSTVPSFRFTWVIRAAPPRERGSTEKLWFWLVISTLPVARSFTGWLQP